MLQLNIFNVTLFKVILVLLQPNYVSVALREIFQFLGREIKFNFIVHLENFYNINFIKYYISSEALYLQSRLK